MNVNDGIQIGGTRYASAEDASAVAIALALDGVEVVKTNYAFDPWVVVRPVKPGDYLNHHGYSDVHPYKVVRVTASGKTAYVREVEATLNPTWKPDIIPGGFAGHCQNNYSQLWVFGAETGPEIAVRLGKNGWKSKQGRHVASAAPRRHHDYNF